jgi:diphosphomevalonate decarboxylase
MASQVWTQIAPSNIALIKYMGKSDTQANRPSNASLSYTLAHLKSIVELELKGPADKWEPLATFKGREMTQVSLSDKGIERFLKHLARIKEHFGFEGAFTVRSANDFPADCGLASSASSFAALTHAGCAALAELTGKPMPSVKELSELSRQGSGSSCRSFFSPWAIWDAEGARELTGEAEGLPQDTLIHQVIVVDDKKKLVSSSDAHVRVTSSALFRGRAERAEERLRDLTLALKKGDWASAFETTWAEFWDMHALFETSKPSFGYMTYGSLAVLRWVRETSWDARGAGPLVTMDAGPNIHLLHKASDRDFARKVASKYNGRYPVISSEVLT